MDLEKEKQEMNRLHKHLKNIIRRQKNPEHKHILETRYLEWMKKMCKEHIITDKTTNRKGKQ
jgi:hypothetical protein|tara:strand:+ start:619 stop:804 length:186 start_codon:yes stop_codon:yes gene_type:complete